MDMHWAPMDNRTASAQNSKLPTRRFPHHVPFPDTPGTTSLNLNFLSQQRYYSHEISLRSAYHTYSGTAGSCCYPICSRAAFSVRRVVAYGYCRRKIRAEYHLAVSESLPNRRIGNT